jgi:hypothetical protein
VSPLREAERATAQIASFCIIDAQVFLRRRLTQLQRAPKIYRWSNKRDRAGVAWMRRCGKLVDDGPRFPYDNTELSFLRVK